MLVRRLGAAAYTLYRLAFRATGVHTFAGTGRWLSPPLGALAIPRSSRDGLQVSTHLARPAQRGNAVRADGISLALKFSLDCGVTSLTARLDTID